VALQEKRTFFTTAGEDATETAAAQQLPRLIAPAHECLECERPLAPHEGPPAPRKFELSTREIAEALYMVGDGSTYRGAGRDIRELTERTRGRWRRFDGSNIADWVELFAPAIFEELRSRSDETA
jgi:hypothetical protein